MRMKSFISKGRTLLLVVCVLLVLPLCAQRGVESFTIVEYNVENLFDTVHAEGKRDAEFTPQGRLHWDTRRYRRKLTAIARAIVAAAEKDVPALVALCEVENDTVLRDLTQRTRLAALGYTYIGTDGPDLRGINVALLYQPLRFRPVSVDTFRVDFGEGVRPSRDLLHVAGQIVGGDTLDIIVCHAPSRMGGRRQTEPQRIRLATQIRHVADSLLAIRQRPALIVTGDFNDELADRPLRRVLGARPADKQFHPTCLYDVCCNKKPNTVVHGSYKFRHRWQHIDHVLLSGSLFLGLHALEASPDCAEILAPGFLLERDGERGFRPRRTFLGTSYHGGTSDHLPTVIRLRLSR